MATTSSNFARKSGLRAEFKSQLGPEFLDIPSNKLCIHVFHKFFFTCSQLLPPGEAGEGGSGPPSPSGSVGTGSENATGFGTIPGDEQMPDQLSDVSDTGWDTDLEFEGGWVFLVGR